MFKSLTTRDFVYRGQTKYNPWKSKYFLTFFSYLGLIWNQIQL